MRDLGRSPRRYAYACWTKTAFRRPEQSGAAPLQDFLDLFIGIEPHTFSEDTQKDQLPCWAPFNLTAEHVAALDSGDASTYPEQLEDLKASCLIIDYDGGKPTLGLSVGGGNPLPPGSNEESEGKVPGPDLSELLLLWDGYAGVFHTTWSHEKEFPRTRVILPLSRDVNANEYERIHKWAELRSTDAGFRADPRGRTLGRRWVRPSSVRQGRLPAVEVVDPEMHVGVSVLPVEVALVLAAATEHSQYAAAASSLAASISLDHAIDAGHGVTTVQEWMKKTPPGTKSQCFCPHVEDSTLGSAWIRRYHSGVALYCSSENHGHDVPLRLWADDPNQGILVARPYTDILDKLHWKRNRNGQRVWPPRTTLSNVEVVLMQDPRVRDRLWQDDFGYKMMLDEEEMTDAMATELILWLERHYGFSATSTVYRMALPALAERRARDTAAEWVLDQAWSEDGREDEDLDGSSILDEWLIRGFGVEDIPMTRMFGRKWIIQTVARALGPGTKGDSVLVLTGAQGRGKSEGFNILCGGDLEDPSPMFSNTALSASDREASAQIRSILIYEIAELAGIRRRDAERVKNFITARSDNHRLPYKTHTTKILRRTSFVATTNHAAFLSDPTGNRRFWPVRVIDFADWVWLRNHRGALWRAAVEAFEAGEPCYFSRDQMEGVAAYTADFEEEDPWDVTIARWLQYGRSAIPGHERMVIPDVFSTAFLARHALGLRESSLNRGTLGQIGRSMSKMAGWKRIRIAVGDVRPRKRVWMYCREYMLPKEAQQWVDSYQDPALIASGQEGPAAEA